MARRAGARPRPRPGVGVGPRHPVRVRRPPVAVAGERSRGDGIDGEHVLHRRPRPRPGAMHRAHGVVTRRARGCGGHTERAGLGAPPGGRRVRPGGGDDRVHGPRGPLPPHQDARQALGGERRHHPRDLAVCGRVRVLRPARRQGAGGQHADHHPPRHRGRAGHARAQRPGLDDLRPQPRQPRGARRHRRTHRRVLHAPLHGRALRDRGADQSHAGPGQFAAPTHREPPTRLSWVLL